MNKNNKLSILLSLTLLLSVFHLQAQAQDHLWKFDQTTGTTSSDSDNSATKVTATLHDVTWQSIPSGGHAVHLDGTDTSYVSFGNTIGQFGTADFTVALWIQTSDKSLNLADIIGNRADVGHGNFFIIRMSQDGTPSTEVDQDSAGTNYIGVKSSIKNLNDGKWHHIAVTRSGKTLTLYVDGNRAGTGSASGVANINNGKEFKLGRSLVASSLPRFSLNASYHDVAIYSSALTATQISSIATPPPSSSGSNSAVGDCWLSSYGRGVGKPLSDCPSGQDKNGALCYPSCSNGYSGVGPVCWQNCPSGFSDTGADCLKPASYGRGAGYSLFQWDQCNNDNKQGCEKYGLLYYPKCANGFSPAGCCVCSPNCPSGMTDIGVSCQKNSYGRGAGTPLQCASGLEEDAALCYTPCSQGFTGKGPVCWAACPTGLYQCGALCLQSQAECTSKMKDIGTKAAAGVLEVAAQVEDPVGAIISAASTVADLSGDLNFPVCPD